MVSSPLKLKFLAVFRTTRFKEGKVGDYFVELTVSREWNTICGLFL